MKTEWKSIIVTLTTREEMKQTSKGKRREANANVKLISRLHFSPFILTLFFHLTMKLFKHKPQLLYAMPCYAMQCNMH